MEVYPDFCISIDGYDPAFDDGTEVIMAESGRPWIYRQFDRETVTFTITHPAMTAEDELTLKQFYALNRDDDVLYNDPRYGKAYVVRMIHPPRLQAMRSGFKADVEMTLVGREYGT